MRRGKELSAILYIAVIIFCCMGMIAVNPVGDPALQNQPPLSLPTTPTNWNERSGVFLYYHIPKTGGTTIRQLFENTASIRSIRVSNPGQLDHAATDIEAILSGNQTEILFVELHGQIPGVFELEERYMAEWRKKSVQSGVPLFAFTLLREPISFYRSYFLHFQGPKCQWRWCEHQTYNITEPSFRQSLVPNPQCVELVHGQRENKKRNKPYSLQNPETDCSRVNQLLHDKWDWVGTTRKMQSITLPLLTQLLLHDNTVGQRASKHNAKTTESLRNLTRATEEYALSLASQDVRLFQDWEKDEAVRAESITRTFDSRIWGS